MIIINKDNIDFLIEKSRIKHTAKEEIIAVTNQLFEVQEILLQMESDTTIYSFEAYIEAKDLEHTLINYLSTLTGGVRW